MVCYRSAPVAYAGGPAFGKIVRNMKGAGLSEKIAYGGKGSEIRADSPKGGPPHFRDLPLCRTKARIVSKNVETLD